MAVIKSLNTDYVITNRTNTLANITLATNTVYVQGNLVVGGNSTAVSRTDLNITDNIVSLNVGETGTGVTLGYAGINVDRGSAANVAVLWNESIGQWTLTNDGTNYVSIATGSLVLAETTPEVYALVL